MAEVLEGLGKMSRDERLRIAYWLLDGIVNGEVVKPVRDDQDEFPFLGYWEDDRSTEEIIADIEGARTIMCKFGECKAKLAAKGQIVEDADILIAATALTFSCPLATENVRHFERFEDLEIQDWKAQDFKEEETR